MNGSRKNFGVLIFGLGLGLGLALGACKTPHTDDSAVKNVEGKPGPTELANSVQPGGHGMVVFGKDTIYMYHLPMWSGLHAWQIIIEVQLDDASRQLYDADRGAGSRLNTFSPDAFPLASLAPGFQFTGSLFHGHFEQGGTPLAADGSQATATVQRIVMITPLKPNLPALGVPTFRVFGNGEEWYAAHVASKRPNFDQVLQIVPKAEAITAVDLVDGVKLTTPGRSDAVAQRLKGGQKANAQLADGTAMSLDVVGEVYFSTSDLGQ